MRPSGSSASTVELVGGRLQVHLACTECSQTAWSHQQIATLAEQVTQQLSQAAATEAPNDLAHSLLGSSVPTVPSPQAEPDPPPLGKKGPRRRTGCFTCRAKRVKCDEAKPICARCERNPERQCIYPKTVAGSTYRTPPKELAVGRSQSPPLAALSMTQSKIGLRRSQHSGRATPSLLPASAPTSLDGTLLSSGQDLLALFLDGVSFLSEPGLLNAPPTKQGARARSDRVLAKLWEAQMIVSAGIENGGLANALVSAARSIGAVKRAFIATRPTEVHDEMVALSNKFAGEAKSVIRAGADDLETCCILLEILLLRDCAAGDPTWSDTHSLMLTFLRRNGGPRKMLDSVGGLNNSLMAHHLVYLTVYDTFASLSLNIMPYLLAPGQWHWIEDFPYAQQVLQGDFGHSLHILFISAKLAALLATPDSTHAEACAMLDELEASIATIYSTPASTRVQFGDLLIRHSLMCQLLCVAFGCNRSEPRVQNSADAIMELLAEVSIRTGSMINLSYPLMVSAVLARKEDRDRLQTIIDFAKLASGLVEVDRVERIAHECWRREAAGEEEMRMTDIWSSRAPMLIL